MRLCQAQIKVVATSEAIVNVVKVVSASCAHVLSARSGSDTESTKQRTQQVEEVFVDLMPPAQAHRPQENRARMQCPFYDNGGASIYKDSVQKD